MKVTNVAQGDSSTFKNDNITVVWTTPIDYGCNVIVDYDVQVNDGSTVQIISAGNVTSTEFSLLTSGTS